MDQDTNSSSPTDVNPAASAAPSVSEPDNSAAVVPDIDFKIPADQPASSDFGQPADQPVSQPVDSPQDEPATFSDPRVTEEVAKKIAESQNVLVALSSDPSVDEMAAAIGLSLFLDKLGKRATAIYSGATPNALEFLKPEETFEPTVDTLQDFVVALDKDKADHLRYKLDGDFVKIFVTPYKTRISEDDLEFSYGDFNVDLVLALNVANGIDLDTALREHGRIMHDAVIINISTGNPGKFGEIEWNDKSASSVSEMISKLLYSIDGKSVGKEEATAFLTGIIAATDRFSNAKTTPETMQIASRLMQSGANQQLIAKNITSDMNNELYSMLKDSVPKHEENTAELDVEHDKKGDEKVEVKEEIKEETPEKPEEPAKVPETAKTPETTKTEAPSPSLLDNLKAAEASLAQAGAETVPDNSNQPIKIEDVSNISAGATEPAEPADYGKMLEDAISELDNPASEVAPEVPSKPEINGVPEINYMPLPGEEVLPPPPTPPIMEDESAPTSLGSQPAMQDQVYTPQASTPDSFKIPGV